MHRRLTFTKQFPQKITIKGVLLVPKNFKTSFDPYLLIKSIWAFYENFITLRFPIYSHDSQVYLKLLKLSVQAVKYCTLCSTVLHCTVLYCTVLYCTVYSTTPTPPPPPPTPPPSPPPAPHSSSSYSSSCIM